jgi:rSAM/selenodomain-associated transferase 1
MSAQNCLIIFTRKPEKGKVKTRLAKGVGEDKALDIYKFLLKRTAEATSKVKAERQVWYTDQPEKNDLWKVDVFVKYSQIEGNLGDKMKYAFHQNFKKNFQKVLIIGTDLFDISNDLIENAFDQLDNNEVVIGPAQDGGYYLLGMRQFIPEVFESIKWSTEHVFQQTLQSITDKSVAVLEKKNDIDYAEDAIEFEALRKIIDL